METIGSAVYMLYLPQLLDIIALEDFGKYNLNIQVLLTMGAICTPEIHERVRKEFRRHGFDEPEVISAFGLVELGKIKRFTMDFVLRNRRLIIIYITQVQLSADQVSWTLMT